jgi:hypothetical protein
MVGTKTRCQRFLKKNGWKRDTDKGQVPGMFLKGEYVAVQVCKESIVLLDDTGDILHLPVSYYALIGALMEYRQITVNYQSTK